MKNYSVVLKLTGEIVVDVKADTLEDALLGAQQLYNGESVEEIGTLKTRKGVDVNYTDLVVTGVLE